MEEMPVAHAELAHDGGVLCGEVVEGGEFRELSGAEFGAWVSSYAGPVVTWGGAKWAKAAGLPPSRLIDLQETFLAANGFRIQLSAVAAPGRDAVAKTVRAVVEGMVQRGRVEWRTRKGVRRGFWVPDFCVPVAALDYAPSPFLDV